MPVCSTVPDVYPSIPTHAEKSGVNPPIKPGGPTSGTVKVAETEVTLKRLQHDTVACHVRTNKMELTLSARTARRRHWDAIERQLSAATNFRYGSIAADGQMSQIGQERPYR
jgi:hypothetical protein